MLNSVVSILKENKSVTIVSNGFKSAVVFVGCQGIAEKDLYCVCMLSLPGNSEQEGKRGAIRKGKERFQGFKFSYHLDLERNKFSNLPDFLNQ